MEKALGKVRLPDKVICPVCGEPLIFVPYSPEELKIVQSQRVLASSKVKCGCGLEGVFNLRKTGEGYYIYSLSFWLLPKAVEKAGTLTLKEALSWLKRPPKTTRL
jgi:hypothetical protein